MLCTRGLHGKIPRACTSCTALRAAVTSAPTLPGPPPTAAGWFRLFTEKLDGIPAVIVVSKLNPWPTTSGLSNFVHVTTRRAKPGAIACTDCDMPVLAHALRSTLGLVPVYGRPDLPHTMRAELRTALASASDLVHAPRAYFGAAVDAVCERLRAALMDANPKLAGWWGMVPTPYVDAQVEAHDWVMPDVVGERVPVWLPPSRAPVAYVTLDTTMQGVLHKYRRAMTLGKIWRAPEAGVAADVLSSLGELAVLQDEAPGTELVHAELYGEALPTPGQKGDTRVGLTRYGLAPRGGLALFEVVGVAAVPGNPDHACRLVRLPRGQADIASGGAATLASVASALGVDVVPLVHAEPVADADDAVRTLDPPVGRHFASAFQGRAEGTVAHVLDVLTTTYDIPGDPTLRTVSRAGDALAQAADTARWRYKRTHTFEHAPCAPADACGSEFYALAAVSSDDAVLAGSVDEAVAYLLATWDTPARRQKAAQRAAARGDPQFTAAHAFGVDAVEELRQHLVSLFDDLEADMPGLLFSGAVPEPPAGEACVNGCALEHDPCTTPFTIFFDAQHHTHDLRATVQAWCGALEDAAIARYMDE